MSYFTSNDIDMFLHEIHESQAMKRLFLTTHIQRGCLIFILFIELKNLHGIDGKSF